MTNYQKLEWLHCQVQELQRGNQLTDYDLLLMEQFIEDVREDYIYDN